MTFDTATGRTGTIGEFARWTRRIVADPEVADGVPKRWSDRDEPAPERESASTEGLVKLLSAENLVLLQAIGRHRPASMRALADLTGRRQSNLSRTLKKLAAVGIVGLAPGPKRTVAPVLLARRVTLDLDLVESTGSVSVTASAR